MKKILFFAAIAVIMTMTGCRSDDPAPQDPKQLQLSITGLPNGYDLATVLLINPTTMEKVGIGKREFRGNVANVDMFMFETFVTPKGVTRVIPPVNPFMGGGELYVKLLLKNTENIWGTRSYFFTGGQPLNLLNVYDDGTLVVENGRVDLNLLPKFNFSDGSHVIALAQFSLFSVSESPEPYTAGGVTTLSRATTHNWMSRVSNSRYLSQLSIPSTHDAGAFHHVVTIGARTQKKNIREQLDAGIRLFDIRVGDGGYIYHGVERLWRAAGHYLHLSFVIDEMIAFLNANPTETVLVSLKPERDEGNFRNHLNNHAFSGTRYNYWHFSNTVPTLGEVRRKLVFMYRYGPGPGRAGININSGLFNRQDLYNRGLIGAGKLDTKGAVAGKKRNRITSHLRTAWDYNPGTWSSTSTWFYNSWNIAYDGTTPLAYGDAVNGLIQNGKKNNPPWLQIQRYFPPGIQSLDHLASHDNVYNIITRGRYNN